MTAQHPHNALGGRYFYYFAEEKAEAQRGKVICSRSRSWWLQSQLGSLQNGWSLSPLGGEAVWAAGMAGSRRVVLFCFVSFFLLF